MTDSVLNDKDLNWLRGLEEKYEKNKEEILDLKERLRKIDEENSIFKKEYKKANEQKKAAFQKLHLERKKLRRAHLAQARSPNLKEKRAYCRKLLKRHFGPAQVRAFLRGPKVSMILIIWKRASESTTLNF